MEISREYDHPRHGVPLALYPEGKIPDWRPIGDDFVPTLTPMFPQQGNRRERKGMVIVAPGGGYHRRAEHERTPFAEFFNAHGMTSALLDYRVAEEVEKPLREGPLHDARRAVRLVRAHADAWGVDPGKIAMLGFSAGGHLTASVGVHARPGDPDGYDAAEKVGSRPDALILGYAVINGRPGSGHGGSAKTLMGEDAAPEILARFDTDAQVTGETPPTFFFHTADDGSVPVAGILHFAAALRNNGVPFEMHIYPSGPHGLGMGADHPGIRDWPILALNWLTAMDY